MTCWRRSAVQQAEDFAWCAKRAARATHAALLLIFCGAVSLSRCNSLLITNQPWGPRRLGVLVEFLMMSIMSSTTASSSA